MMVDGVWASWRRICVTVLEGGGYCCACILFSAKHFLGLVYVAEKDSGELLSWKGFFKDFGSPCCG